MLVFMIFVEEEEEDDAKDFKGAVDKFHRLFKLPREEKLVNCMLILYSYAIK